jgi:hypothetical protein
MKRLVMALLALGIGCGNADETRLKTLEDDLQEGDRVMVNGEEFVALEPVIDSYDDLARFSEELDELEKATGSLQAGSPFATTYIIPNGYGIAGGGVRCNNTSFPGGTCKVPKLKSGCVRHLADQESPPTAMRTAAATAHAPWETTMEAHGFPVLFNDVACAFSTQGQISIRWGNLPAGVGGKMTPLINSGDLVNVPQGQLQPWRIAQITLDPSEIAAHPLYASRTQAEKNRFARNTLMHELFHAGGIAHNGILDTLMADVVLQPPPVSSYFTSDMSALGAEMTLIQGYEVED